MRATNIKTPRSSFILDFGKSNGRGIFQNVDDFNLVKIQLIDYSQTGKF